MPKQFTGLFRSPLSGVGKEIFLNNGNVVDIYGKYYYNRKNSVSFMF